MWPLICTWPLTSLRPLIMGELAEEEFLERALQTAVLAEWPPPERGVGRVLALVLVVLESERLLTFFPLCLSCSLGQCTAACPMQWQRQGMALVSWEALWSCGKVLACHSVGVVFNAVWILELFSWVRCLPHSASPQLGVEGVSVSTESARCRSLTAITSFQPGVEGVPVSTETARCRTLTLLWQRICRDWDSSLGEEVVLVRPSEQKIKCKALWAGTSLERFHFEIYLFLYYSVWQNPFYCMAEIHCAENKSDWWRHLVCNSWWWVFWRYCTTWYLIKEHSSSFGWIHAYPISIDT